MVLICENDGSEADVESEDEGNENEDKLQGLAGMGDVISKILEKSIPKNTDTILCKSKKSQKRKLESKQEYAAKKEKEEKNVEKREKNHVIPTRGNAQKEILLKKIATKGVVKLLNAVSAHQKLVSEKMKAEKTEAGKEKAAENVTKKDFMDMLKKKQPEKKRKQLPKNENEDDSDEEENKKPKKWDVFREDLMLGSSFKDWDKMDSDKEDSSNSNPDSTDDEDE